MIQEGVTDIVLREPTADEREKSYMNSRFVCDTIKLTSRDESFLSTQKFFLLENE
jgi:hypothetical protein